jgi:hypothetical protein
MESSSDEQPVSKKSTTQRVRAKRISPASRERAARGVQPAVTKPKASTLKSEEGTLDSSNKRRAPTPFAASKKARRLKQKRNIIVVLVMVVGVAASAAVGLIDEGQINVQQIVEDRNERIRTNTQNERDTLKSTVAVPVQNPSKKPEGGLKGFGVGANPPPPEPRVSSSTATSSDEFASSTVEVADDVENEAEEDGVSDDIDESNILEVDTI